MRAHLIRSLIVATVGFAAATFAIAADVGPANGSLVVAGGGVTDPAIYERFEEILSNRPQP